MKQAELLTRLTCLAMAVLAGGATLSAQEAEAPAAAPSSPPPAVEPAEQVPAEYSGYAAAPRRVDELDSDLAAADAALARRDWKEAVAALERALGPSQQGEGGPRINTEGDRYLTADRALFTSVAAAVARRARELPAEVVQEWRQRRGGAWTPVPRAVAGEPPAAQPWRLGGYSTWIHRLTNFRELRSGTPAKNAYYAYSPMRLAFAGDLAIGRSHQDVVAFDRNSGEVRWRVTTDVPQNEQTTLDGRTSAFDSWRYFTDLGGWSVAVVAGDKPSIIVIDKPARLVVTSEKKLTCARNKLRAYDATSGTKLWERGGPEDADEALRGLTFLAAPAVAGEKGETLVAPATSGDAFYLIGMTLPGALSWVHRLHDYRPEEYERLDETMAHGASLAVAGDVVVAAPGQGFVVAMTTGGEALWQARYPSSIRTRPNEPRWGPGHPLVSAGKAIAAPFDGDALVVHDLVTGELAWSKKLTSGYHHLAGADEANVYVLDGTGRVTAYALNDGSVSWTSDSLGPPAGRGLVAAGHLHVAVDRAVVVLDARSGKLIKRCRIWDDRVPSPCPGNLQLFGGDLFLAAPWGYARLQSYDETLATLEGLDLREQLVRKAMVSQAMGNFTAAFDTLRQVLASTNDAQAKDTLRAELFQTAQDAAATTKDVKFIERVLAEPDLLPSKAHRTAFVLRSLALLQSGAPDEAGRLCRSLIDDTAPDDVAQSPEGLYVNVAAYAADWLDAFRRERGLEANPEEEERVGRQLRAALGSEDPYARMLGVVLSRAHTDGVLAGWAHLAKLAAATDAAVAASWLDRLAGRSPELGAAAELAGLRRQLAARMATAGESAGSAAAPAWAEAARWSRKFFGKSAGAELVSSCEGSDPLPGMLITRAGTIALLDDAGTVTWKHVRQGIPDLAAARDKLAAGLFEPAWAHARDGRCLVFTAFGLADVAGLGGPDARARQWLALKHPLAATAPAEPAAPRATTKAKAVRVVRDNVAEVKSAAQTPAAKVAVDTSTSFFPRLAFTAAGNALVVSPDGTLVEIERRTGRMVYRASAAEEAAAGAPQPAGGLVAVASARPPGVIVHDTQTRARVVIPAPGPPWRVIVVPGLALVTDSQAGIQVRQLATFSGHEVETPAIPIVLWRDARPRGSLSLAFADGEQVVAVEGGKLTGRALTSGRQRWEAPFPEGASPSHVVELTGAGGAPGDLLIVAVRGHDPESGRGLVSQRASRDLIALRIGRDGTMRWQAMVEGQVAFESNYIPLSAGRAALLFNHKDTDWRARAIALDLDRGTLADLFSVPFDGGATVPPPRVAVTRTGIAVGNAGSWALFAPDPGP